MQFTNIFEYQYFYLDNLLSILRSVASSWYNYSYTLYGWLNTRVQNLISNFGNDVIEGDNDVIELFFDQIGNLWVLFFGEDVTVLGVCFGYFFPLVILFSILAVVARWVLDIGPL